MSSLIPPKDFTIVTRRMRDFFTRRGFLEVHTQNRLSILAACEDPKTVSTYDYSGEVWPLPQTGQMWLEYELLNDPSLPGVFCVSTSYRQEPTPVPGRHDLIFPMFEFESSGSFEDLIEMNADLCSFLGFQPDGYPVKDYEDWMKLYHVPEGGELGYEEEGKMQSEHDSGVAMIVNFPYRTSPFWNMKKDGDIAKKCDVIMGGMETIGSAERSTDKDEMKHQFNTISDGLYADLLYSKFGKDRVVAELDKFLEFDFFERYGGGIGVTRMISAAKSCGVNLWTPDF